MYVCITYTNFLSIIRYTWPKNRHKGRRQKEHNIIETKKLHATLNNGNTIEILDAYTNSLADLEIF